LHEFSEPTPWLDSMVTAWESLGGPALQARGTFHVSLSGGSTPKPQNPKQMNQFELKLANIIIYNNFGISKGHNHE